MWWRSTALLLLVGSVLVAQPAPTEKGFVIHGMDGRMSIFNPVSDQYVADSPVPGVPIWCATYPSPMTADRIIYAQNGGELLSVSINNHSILGVSDLTAPANGVCRVQTSIWKDHLAVVGPNPVSPSTSTSIFMLVDPVTLIEHQDGVFASGSNATSWVSIAATHSTQGDTNPNNDMLRYWIFDDGNEGGVSRISFINLTYAQTLSGTGGPWNPITPTPGPGYPLLHTQLDQNPNTMLELALMPNHAGNNVRMLPWVEPGTGTNYVFVIDCAGATGFQNRIGIINADTAVFQGTVSIGSIYSQPCFLDADIADNYIVMSEGISSAGSGGNVARFVHIPSLIGPGTPVKDTHNLTGVYGVKVNIDRDKVYLGTDESDNRVVVLPVDLTHPTTPVAGPEHSFNLLTTAEFELLNPPNRAFPRCFAFIRVSPGPFGGGGGGGSSGGGGGGGCSADTGRSNPLVSLLILLLLGLGSARYWMPSVRR